jgi:hypothetical protein
VLEFESAVSARVPSPGQLSPVPGTEYLGRFVVAGAKDGRGYNKNKAIKMKVETTILASE